MSKSSPKNGECNSRMRPIVLLALSGLIVCLSSTACAGLQVNPQQPSSTHSQSFEQLASHAQEAMEANRIPEAIRLYARATALRPAWSEGWWYLGTMFFDGGQYINARDAFVHFISTEHRQAGPGFGMLGLTEFQLKDNQKALAALERGSQLGLGDNAPFVHRVLYVDGILNNLFGRPEIALVRLTLVANQLADAHPEAPKDAVLGDNELLDAFGLAALRIFKLPADIPPAQSTLVRQAGHAQALVALQDRAAAGSELKELIARYPSQAGVHYDYGVYLLKEDPPSAIGEFRREIEISPKSAAARIQLALEFLRTADYQQGLKYAQEAVVLAPGDFVAHVACGRLWLGLGNTDRALHELRTAVRLSPGSPDAHFALSRALSDAGLSQQAAKERSEFERLKALANAADR